MKSISTWNVYKFEWNKETLSDIVFSDDEDRLLALV